MKVQSAVLSDRSSMDDLLIVLSAETAAGRLSELRATSSTHDWISI